MVFSSVTFLFYFLPLFLLCYAILPFRNATALLFSSIFYVWGEGIFVLLLVASVMLNFICGQLVSAAEKPAHGRYWLAFGITVNLLLLFYFKYFGFFVFDLVGLDSFNPDRVPHLPLGISFFTFQSISYLIDVYRRQATPARSVWDLALYIMLFPQLIAGPIVRYSTVARQIRRRTLHLNYVRHGLLFFSVGLAQKVLIANNVAVVADPIFDLPLESLSTTLAWAGSLAYTLQIYFDFAGYSNMAIGLGLCMGFKFPRNFNYPYISQSITEFWRRWHMSLSSWFRDYLYIPLGGNRNGAFETYRNLFTVFVLCGLWHGAAWTFLWWGVYHGLLLVLERLWLGRLLVNVPRLIRHTYALGAIIVGWVLFRAESVDQIQVFLLHMVGVGAVDGSEPGLRVFVGNQQLFFALVGILASTPLLRRAFGLFITDRQVSFSRRQHSGGMLRNVLDASFVIVLLGICSLYIAAGTYNPFIYFRF